jgi:hypothetical protein
MSNIESGSQKVGEIIGYGAAAGLKALGQGLAGLGRGLRKGATQGMDSSPNLPTGPITALGQTIGNVAGAARRSFREAQERNRRERTDAEFGWEQNTEHGS